MLAFDPQADPFGDIPITRPSARPPMLGQQAPLVGPPRQPQPQTAPQYQHDVLENARIGQQIESTPISNANTATQTAHTQQEITQQAAGGHNFTAEQQMRQQYRADPRIQNYESILPVYRAAQT